MRIKSTRKTKRYNKKETRRVDVVNILTNDQIKAIDRIENDRDRGICQMLLHTGLRIDELVNVSYGDVFEDIRRKQTATTLALIGKGNKMREIPLNTVALNAILAIDRYNRKELKVEKITKYTPLIVSRVGKRMSKVAIRNVIRKEIDSNPHTIRHTALTLLRKAGVELEVIQKIAGHSSITTTAKYYLSVNNEDLKTAMDRLVTPLGELKLASVAN